LFDLNERPLLAGVIGEQAEGWVYLYGSCDRRVVYPNLANSGSLRFQDRFTGQGFVVAEQEAETFVELTAANELDLAMVNPAFAHKFGNQLFTLIQGARRRLSDPAWTCCVETLAGR
jgi:hypothetical protein